MARLLAALIALVLIVPSAAAAQTPRTNAPPGNSAIDEYLETVPAASGNRVPRAPDKGTKSSLTPAQTKALEKLGEDGKTLAKVVESTSPAKASPATKQPATTLRELTGRSPLGEVLGVAEGNGGMGLILPAILLGSLLAVIALVLLRRRRSPS